MTIDNIVSEPTGRWRRLKEATAERHERLDRRIMAAAPFSSRDRYGLFLKVQHAFHRDIRALYDRAPLQAIFADLAQRRRLEAVTQDLADLGLDVSGLDGAASVSLEDADVPTAVGWLYVAEGSNLGAAFLLKAAARLDLSESFGARHLAAAPEGRAVSWRNFTTALDALTLNEAEEEQLFAGAREAFARVHALVEATLPIAATASTSENKAAEAVS